MKLCFNYKFFLNFCNILFLLCGISLIVAGCYLFTDNKRILLSRLLADRFNALPQPLLYYIALGLAIAGFIVVLVSLAGFWASCLHTYCFFSIYFLSVVALLLTESVTCLAITLWPHCLGINLDESQMIKSLQTYYGVPGHEQYTNAMDLAQTRFGCCGMKSSLDYDTSLWRLQSYGQTNWPVPLSCCVLENAPQPLAYLDPKPANESQCQSLDHLSYERERHMESCLVHLDTWYREQYSVFLGASLLMALVEFLVLLAIIMSCTGLASQRARLENILNSTALKRQQLAAVSKRVLVENVYDPEVKLRVNSGHSLNGICLEKSSRHVSNEDFTKLYLNHSDPHTNGNNASFEPISANFQRQRRNYLV